MYSQLYVRGCGLGGYFSAVFSAVSAPFNVPLVINDVGSLTFYLQLYKTIYCLYYNQIPAEFHQG